MSSKVNYSKENFKEYKTKLFTSVCLKNKN